MLENIKKVFEINWVDYIYKKYKEIPEFYRKVFWILFIYVNLMFIFHTINFLFGNCDFCKESFSIKNNVFEGRFTNLLLTCLFFQGYILPVVTNLFAFLGFILGTLFLFRYWELDKNIKYFIIASLIFTCNPLINSRLFLELYIIEYLWCILFVVLGLIFAIKERKRILSILLLLFAISTYQPCINTIFVVLFGKLFIKSVEGNFQELWDIFKKSFINISISCLLYFLIYKICAFYSIIDTSFYNQQTISSFEMLFEHIKLAVNSIYSELFNYERILYPQIITKLFLMITIIAVISCVIKIFSEKSNVIKRLTITFFIFILLLFSTQISQIVAEFNVFGTAKVLFYGSLFFNIFMLVLVFKYANIKLKNITYLICFILFMEYITVNFVSQKSFKFATISEVLRMDRIANRIEEHPDYSPDKIYSILCIGELPPARPFYVGKFNGTWDKELGGAQILPSFNFYSGLTFYNNDFKIKDSYTCCGENPIHPENYLTRLKPHINELKPWPSKDCIVIDDDLIIILLDEESLERCKEYISLWED